MAGAPEPLSREISDRAVERFGLGVGIHNQHIHGGSRYRCNVPQRTDRISIVEMNSFYIRYSDEQSPQHRSQFAGDFGSAADRAKCHAGGQAFAPESAFGQRSTSKAAPDFRRSLIVSRARGHASDNARASIVEAPTSSTCR